MKILLATYWAVPHVGGVWPFMQQLQKQLQARGHEVDLLGNGGDPGDPNVSIIGKAKFHKSKVRPLLAEKLSKETYPFIHRNQLVLYTELERYMFELAAAYLNVERYDVIHAQDVIASGCIQRVRSGGAALVASLHGSVAREVERQFGTIHKSSTTPVAKAYFHALEHFGASSPEATIVANNWLKNMLIQDFNVPAQKLRLYPYGYDQAAFTDRMKQASDVRKPAGKKVIMFAGRLIELKAPHHLTGALAGLKKQRSDWVCWIVGEGDMQVKLRAQIKALGLEDDVVFWGKRQDVPQMLQQADIFVQPSLLDNQPLSVIEAQLAGLPVIVSDSGGLPEMVSNGQTGLTYPVGDIDSLGNHLKMLLENDELRLRMGANAKQWAARHWDLNQMVDHYLAVYEYAIQKRRGGARG